MRSDQARLLAPTRLPFPCAMTRVRPAPSPLRAAGNHEGASPAKQPGSQRIFVGDAVAVLINVPRRVDQLARDSIRVDEKSPAADDLHRRELAWFGIEPDVASSDEDRDLLARGRAPKDADIARAKSFRKGTSTERASRASRPASAASSLVPVERVSHRQVAHPVLQKLSEAIVRRGCALGEPMRTRRLGERPRRPVPRLDAPRDLGRSRPYRGYLRLDV